MPTVTFSWQHNGLQALSTQRGKSELSFFKKSYLLLLFIQCVWMNMDITCSTSIRKSVELWSHKYSSFHFRKVEVWLRACCCGDIITTITTCSSYSPSTLQNFNNVDLCPQIFCILLFHIIVCTLFCFNKWKGRRHIKWISSCTPITWQYSTSTRSLQWLNFPVQQNVCT